MNGTGNDFVIIDNRLDVLKNISLPDFARTICRRDLVGADGLILIENSQVADFKWRFFNSDGSEAEMCGNGGRCVARFALLKGIANTILKFETKAGIIQAEVKNSRVKLQLPQPTNIKLNQEIFLDNKPYSMHYINTGVPHVGTFTEDLDRVPVKELGKKIRFHPVFQPAGTNVNFIQRIDSFHLNVRTYERGVEDETFACGTGSVASALIAAALKLVQPPVEVKTRGGEILTIYFQKAIDNSFSHIFLEGNTCLVFEATLGEDVCFNEKN